jgi:hypothetical protein
MAAPSIDESSPILNALPDNWYPEVVLTLCPGPSKDISLTASRNCAWRPDRDTTVSKRIL